MKKLTKKILVGTLALSIIGTSSSVFAQTHSVQAGDTFWKISQEYDVDVNNLLSANNANQSTILMIGEQITIPEEYDYYTVKSGDTPWLISNKVGISLDTLMDLNSLSENTYIYEGQVLKIPLNPNVVNLITENEYYIVKSGDTPWLISEKLNVSLQTLLVENNLSENTYIYAGQKLKVPSQEIMTSQEFSSSGIPVQPQVTITYKIHTVQSGETFWSISMSYGIQVNELLKANSANSSTSLSIGDKVKVPTYNVPVMATLGTKYGEYLDWWKASQYVIPIGAEITVIDFYTGKSFEAKRTTGANHADVETITSEDTAKMKDIWGGTFSWSSRPAILEYNGRRVAASISSLPHAGNDNAPGGYYTDWRSDDYGPGLNFDYVKDNNMHGHFDIHFLNSTRHKDGQVDDSHQKNIKIAAGIIK